MTAPWEWNIPRSGIFRLCLTACAAGLLLANAALAQQPAGGATRFSSLPLFAVNSTAHSALVPQIAITPDERYLVSVGFDRVVRIWDAKTGEPKRQYFVSASGPNDAQLYAVAVSPDGKQVALGGWNRAFSRDFSAVIMELNSGRIERVISGFRQGVTALAWSSDGRWLAAGTDDSPQGALLRIFETSGYSVVHEARGLPGRIRDLRFRGDGMLAAAIIRFGKSSQVQLLQPKGAGFGHVATRVMGGYGANRARWTADEKRLLVGWNWLLDGETLRDLPFLARRAHFGYPNAVGPTGLFQSADGVLVSMSYSRHVDRGFLRQWEPRDPPGSGPYQELEIPDARNLDALMLRDGTFIYCTELGAIAAVDRNLKPLWRHALVQAEYDLHPEALRVSGNGEWITVPFSDGGKRTELLFNLREPRFAVPGAVETTWNTPAQSAGGTRMNAWEGTETPTVNFKAIRLRNGERALSVAVHSSGSGVALGSNHQRLRRVRPDGSIAWERYLLAQVLAVNLIESRGLVVAATSDGRVHLVRWEDGAHLLSYLLLPNKRQWLAFTSTGRYEAGIGAEDLAGWSVNRGAAQAADFFPLSKFRSSLLAPGISKIAFDTADPKRLAPAPGPVSAPPSPPSREAEPAKTVPEQVAPPSPLSQEAAPAETVSEQVAPVAPAADIERILPPVVEVLHPAFDVSATDTRINLRYRVKTQSDAPVTAIRTRFTSASQQRSLNYPPPASSGADHEFTLEIAPEDTEIQLFAENRHGVSAPATLSVRWAGAKPQPADARGRLYVLSIGVSDYDRAEYKLGLPAKDAHDFIGILERQRGRRYRDVVAKELLDKQANRAAVLAAFDWLRAQAGSRDTVMLFLAGHGVNDAGGEYYFMPSDANADRLAESSVSFRDIRRTMTSLQGRALMFIDTCHSGNVLGKALRNRSSDNTNAVNEIAGAENGIVVFASSTGSQLSQESPAWGNGAFTKALVEGLRGEADLTKRGRITYKQLDAFVSDRVEELTRGQQTPVTPVLVGIPDFTIAEVVSN